MEDTIDTVIGMNEKTDFDAFPRRLITNTEIEDLGFKWVMRDDPLITEGTLEINEPYIFNTDVSTGEGIHWTVILDNGSDVFYYDPLSTKVQKAPKEILEYAKRNKRNNLYTNPWPHQHIKSNLCGYYSLYAADKFTKHFPITPEKFYNILKKSHGTSEDTNDVRRVLKWSRKNGVY